MNDFPKNMTFQRFNDLRKPKFRHLIYMHMARGVWKSRKKVEEQKELVEQSRKLTKFLISHFAVRLLHAKKKGHQRNPEVGSCQEAHTHMHVGRTLALVLVRVCVCVPAIPGRNKKFKTLAHIRIWSEDHVLNKYYSSFECSHTVGYTCYPFGQDLMSCLYRFPFNFAASWWAFGPLLIFSIWCAPINFEFVPFQRRQFN